MTSFQFVFLRIRNYVDSKCLNSASKIKIKRIVRGKKVRIHRE